MTLAAAPALSTEIAVEAGGWEALPDLETRLVDAVEAAARLSGVALRKGAEVSILLSDDATLQALNKSWRRQDKPTNVLSFPAVGADALATAPMLGDIAIAYETASREAEAEGKVLIDHVTHLCVHGFLHLVGFDHLVDDEAEAMEARERTILASLGIADPYADKS